MMNYDVKSVVEVYICFLSIFLYWLVMRTD